MARKPNRYRWRTTITASTHHDTRIYEGEAFTEKQALVGIQGAILREYSNCVFNLEAAQRYIDNKDTPENYIQICQQKLESYSQELHALATMAPDVVNMSLAKLSAMSKSTKYLSRSSSNRVFHWEIEKLPLQQNT